MEHPQKPEGRHAGPDRKHPADPTADEVAAQAERYLRSIPQHLRSPATRILLDERPAASHAERRRRVALRGIDGGRADRP